MTPAELQARMAELGVVPKKSLGQNFLIGRHVIDKIIHAVEAESFATLIEVGPGLGSLTEPLVASGQKPQLIEYDTQFAKYWHGRGLEVHEGDALKIDWNKLQLKPPTLLVSNLPYQISTSIVVERCLGPESVEKMILMFQKEVAQRLTADVRSKEYGFLSVMAQLHFQMTKVADAAPGDFFPAPKVASRVLRFQRQPRADLGPQFLRFVKAAFAFRRKFLLKNLKGVVDKAMSLNLPRIFRELGISVNARAEELTPEQFVTLYKKVYEH